MGIGRLFATQILDVMNLKSLAGFSFHRFNVVNQFLWYYIFACLVFESYNNTSRLSATKIISILFVFLTLINCLRKNISVENIRCLINNERFKYHVKFSDYYMLDEYKEIDKILPKDKKRYSVLHYGFDPAASNYHNYITFDGIFPFYSKQYNKTFDELRAPLLAEKPDIYKNAILNNYIVTDNYKHTHNFLQNYSKAPKELKISFETAKSTNIKYILSTIPFTNKELKLISTVSSTFWEKIYIYEVL